MQGPQQYEYMDSAVTSHEQLETGVALVTQAAPQVPQIAKNQLQQDQPQQQQHQPQDQQQHQLQLPEPQQTAVSESE